jgi:hypothetical protein
VEVLEGQSLVSHTLVFGTGGARSVDGAEKGLGDRLPHGRGSLNTCKTRSLDNEPRA